jgi:prepilin-type N-terminal cleavage/methylation domain-containing protein
VRILFGNQGRRAFTLIELVISGALMSVILAAGYVCLTTGTSSQNLVEARSDAAQTARVALGMIAADLRSAVPLSEEYEFIGMQRTLDDIQADNLDFATRNYVPKRQGEGDWCETSYFVQKDPKSGEYVLYRRRDPTPDPEPLSGGNPEEIARGVRAFRLEYYDGWDWYDEWGDPLGKQKFSALPDPNVSGLPEAVRIVLSLTTGEKVPEGMTAPELVVETTARLNMALFFYRTTSGSSSTNNASGAPQQSAQPAPGGPQ